MDRILELSWLRCWQQIGVQNQSIELRERLICAYREPHRHYHSVQHLIECLQLFDSLSHIAEQPGEVEIALWFHDAIYDITSNANEQLSAQWASRELLKAGVDADVSARISGHILATRHKTLPEGNDQALLVDIDLAILGAQPARFDEYEKQIRLEYHFVPNVIFKSKRKKLLRQFLERKTIYTTPGVRQSLEEPARQNIRRVLSSW